MQKLYHSISEVSELVDEEQHILRYWEKEFEQLNPKKNRGGNRIYSEKDVLVIKTIKKFLREDKLSLKGAKEQLDKFLANQNGSNTLFVNGNLQDKNINQSMGNTLFTNSAEAQNNTLQNEDIKEIHQLLKDIAGYLRQ